MEPIESGESDKQFSITPNMQTKPGQKWPGFFFELFPLRGASTVIN
jgi:hypothetical protein